MKFNEEQKEFMFEFVPGHHYHEILKGFNERFPDTPITMNQVKGFIGRYKLNTGFNGRFESGRTPHNKGKKMPPEVYDKCQNTMFKKGSIPPNKRNIGSSRITVDGYVEIKVADPGVWELRSRLVWERENGVIPDNHVILHKNGIKDDDSIENLVLLSRAELACLNEDNFFKLYGDIDINEVAIMLAKLKDQIRKRSKNK